MSSRLGGEARRAASLPFAEYVARYGQVTPAHVGAAPAVELPLAAAQSDAVRSLHVDGWPAGLDGTQQATGCWQPAQTLPVPEL
jgi:hypothetical protein